MSNKQYYTNLNPNEKVIENRFGSKVVMDNSGNVLLTTSRRTEYIDQLRQENYQGNINLSPDEEGSFFYVGTGQVDLNQQGNINQESLTLEPQSDIPTPLDEPAIGLYTTYDDDYGFEPGTPFDLRVDEPTENFNIKKIIINNWTATKRAELLKKTYPSDFIGSNVFTKEEKERLSGLANLELDIFNPNRITQPISAYSKDDNGKERDFKLPRPYYTEYLAEPQFRDEGYKSEPIVPYLMGSLAIRTTPPQHIISQKLYDTLKKYSKNETIGFSKNVIKQTITGAFIGAFLPTPGSVLRLAAKGATTSYNTFVADTFLLKGNDEVPWSAYFISWLVSQVDPSFPSGAKGASHYLYSNENKSPKWELYPLPYYDDFENKDASGKSIKVKIDIGDILISPRSGGNGSSHGDVVYSIDSINKKAYLIGGNIDDTVMITPVNIDANGYYSSNQPYREVKNDSSSIDPKDTGYVTYLVVLKRMKR
jgi:hypothetical protein